MTAAFITAAGSSAARRAPTPPAGIVHLLDSDIMRVMNGDSGEIVFVGEVPAGTAVFVSLSLWTPDGTDAVLVDNQGNALTKVGQSGARDFLASCLFLLPAVEETSDDYRVAMTCAANSYITGAGAVFLFPSPPELDVDGVANDAVAVAGRSVSTDDSTTAADELSIALVAPFSNSTPLEDVDCAGFIITWQDFPVGSSQPGAMAYRIETTTGTKTADWTWGAQGGTQANALISCFKAS